jgi:hypothetical protein
MRCHAEKTMTKHGHCIEGKSSKLYNIWHGIKQRCENPRNRHYQKYYGGAGIHFQANWSADFATFEREILALLGPLPTQAHELDRWPDAHGSYEAGNVRWATRTQQQNNRRDNKLRTLDGERIGWTAAAWYLAMPRGALHYRFRVAGVL